jgi:Winged helix-turn helix
VICPVLEPFQRTWNGGRVERLTRIGIMRFEELLERFERGSLSHGEAAAALGVSERPLRRWRQRYKEDGADGLVDRRVGNDNCVRWHGQSLQIAPSPLRPHLVRATVRVHDYPDGTLPSARDRSGWRASRRQQRRAPRTWPRDHRDATRHHNSGQPMRYLLRTKRRARYSRAHWATRRNAGRPPRSIQWSAFQPCDPTACASSIRASARLPRLADVSHRGTWRMEGGPGRA